MLNQSDAQLVALIRANNNMQAFGELVTRYEPSVRLLLDRLCKGSRYAEDLTQDTFLRALDRLPQVNDLNRLKPWLASIAYREFLMWTRANKRYNQVMEQAAHLTQTSHTPDPEVVQLDHYLSVLRDSERDAILLAHGAGLTQQEVSKTMDLPLGTVKSLINRGKQRITDKFSDTQRASNVA